MALTKDKKLEICEKYGDGVNNVGTPQVQIALMSERIKILTKHLSENSKDFSSRRGLFILIGRRSRLLSYLMKKNSELHKRLTAKLGIRIKKVVSSYA